MTRLPARGWKRGLRFLGFLAIALVSLVALVLSINSYRGRQEWAQTKADLLTRGERLSLNDLVPPPLPDGENFYADPLWAEIIRKRVKKGEGEGSHVSMVPEEKQRWRVLMRKPAPAEAAALTQQYPQLAGLDLTKAPSALLLTAWREAGTHDAAWRQSLAALTLQATQPAQPVLDQIKELLKRPGARFPIDYNDTLFAQLPHIPAMLHLAQIFSMKARAECLTGQADAAFQDTITLFGMARTLNADGFYLSYLVRLQVLTLALSTIDTGMDAHRWTAAQLDAFEAELKKVDLAGDLRDALRFDRASYDTFMERMLSGNPAYTAAVQSLGIGNEGGGDLGNFGLVCYANLQGPADLTYTNRSLQSIIDLAGDTYWKDLRALSILPAPPEFTSKQFRLTHIFSVLMMPSWLAGLQKSAKVQDSIVQGRIACGLERYYLANHEYPEALRQLVPTYLAAIPRDVLTLRPMHYDRPTPESYRLWSEGWDQKDDQARPSASGKAEEGDWVWGELGKK